MLNQEEIKKIIPHRDPFLLIERAEIDLEARKATAWKQVTENEFWVPGHFPEEPIMPGVLTLESMAQTGAVALLSIPEFQGKIAVFAKADKVKWKGMIKPGDEVRYEAELTNLRSAFGMGIGKAYINDKLVCSCEMMFGIYDPKAQ